MQIRPTAFTIGLIIHFSIALFCVYTEFGVDSNCWSWPPCISRYFFHICWTLQTSGTAERIWKRL